MKKINLRVDNDTFVMFSNTQNFITENNWDNILIIIDMSCMEEQFKKYFVKDLNTEKFIWMQNHSLQKWNK